LAFQALSLTWLQKVLTAGAFFSAFSSGRFQAVVIYKVTIRGAYDLPDYFIVWLVLDLIDKIVVCPGAWWWIADYPL
jgi:hypothetical protein